MSNYNTIKNAIQSKQSLTLTYQGRVRKVCPHAIGLKNGKEQALFYQYGGSSKSGISSNPVENWLCISLDGISNIIKNNDAFVSSGNHSKQNTCIDKIDLEISY